MSVFPISQWLRGIEPLKISVPICFSPSRKKYSGWCTCGPCVETRRSSTHMLPGDYLTSPPLAPNRSSKTLWDAQNTLTQGENILYLNRPWSWLGRKGGRGRHTEMRDRQVGHGLTSQQKDCEVVLLNARCFTFSFSFFWLQWLWV